MEPGRCLSDRSRRFAGALLQGEREFLVLEMAPKYLVWASDELAVSAPFEISPLWYGADEQLRHLMLTLHHELQAKCLSGRLFGEYVGLSFATVLLTRHCADHDHP